METLALMAILPLPMALPVPPCPNQRVLSDEQKGKKDTGHKRKGSVEQDRRRQRVHGAAFLPILQR